MTSSAPSIVVDAGPLIALFDRDDRHHRRAVEFLRKSRLRTHHQPAGPYRGDIPFAVFRGGATRSSLVGAQFHGYRSSDTERPAEDHRPARQVQRYARGFCRRFTRGNGRAIEPLARSKRRPGFQHLPAGWQAPFRKYLLACGLTPEDVRAGGLAGSTQRFVGLNPDQASPGAGP